MAAQATWVGEPQILNVIEGCGVATPKHVGATGSAIRGTPTHKPIWHSGRAEFHVFSMTTNFCIPAEGSAREAHRILCEAAETLGAEVGDLRSVYEIPMRSGSDRPAFRARLAKAVYELLGEEALANGIDVTLNGTSLSPELLDRAYAPRVVHAV